MKKFINNVLELLGVIIIGILLYALIVTYIDNVYLEYSLYAVSVFVCIGIFTLSTSYERGLEYINVELRFENIKLNSKCKYLQYEFDNSVPEYQYERDIEELEIKYQDACDEIDRIRDLPFSEPIKDVDSIDVCTVCGGALRSTPKMLICTECGKRRKKVVNEEV